MWPLVSNIAIRTMYSLDYWFDLIYWFLESVYTDSCLSSYLNKTPLFVLLVDHVGLFCQKSQLVICLHSENNCSITRGLPASIVSPSIIQFSLVWSLFLRELILNRVKYIFIKLNNLLPSVVVTCGPLSEILCKHYCQDPVEGTFY